MTSTQDGFQLDIRPQIAQITALTTTGLPPDGLD